MLEEKEEEEEEEDGEAEEGNEEKDEADEVEEESEGRMLLRWRFDREEVLLDVLLHGPIHIFTVIEMLEQAKEPCKFISHIQISSEVFVFDNDVSIVSKDVTKDHASEQEDKCTQKSFIVVSRMIVTKSHTR